MEFLELDRKNGNTKRGFLFFVIFHGGGFWQNVVVEESNTPELPLVELIPC
jgi:hypothetical protein